LQLLLARSAAKAQLIRDTIAQLDQLYRSSKQIKRLLRSKITEIESNYVFEKQFFDLQMEELSNVQIGLEQCWQIIKTRTDVFYKDRRRRIRRELSYSERYLCDVVQEFEKRLITRIDDDIIVNERCVMIRDFLGPSVVPSSLNDDFTKMCEESDLKARFNAFERLKSSQQADEPNSGKNTSRRYKAISNEAMRLALREMREATMFRIGTSFDAAKADSDD
jgi:hypothetical protein